MTGFEQRCHFDGVKLEVIGFKRTVEDKEGLRRIR